MAITPQQFFNKSTKWFLLAFVLLFLFKSVQSCNRNMKLNITSKQYIHIIDSLENKYNIYYKESQDSIKELNFQLRLATERVEAAENRANAIQNVAEKVRANTTTTVNVRGLEEVKDTSKKK